MHAYNDECSHLVILHAWGGLGGGGAVFFDTATCNLRPEDIGIGIRIGNRQGPTCKLISLAAIARQSKGRWSLVRPHYSSVLLRVSCRSECSECTHDDEVRSLPDPYRQLNFDLDLSEGVARIADPGRTCRV